jgi:hypothetical protein
VFWPILRKLLARQQLKSIPREVLAVMLEVLNAGTAVQVTYFRGDDYFENLNQPPRSRASKNFTCD